MSKIVAKVKTLEDRKLITLRELLYYSDYYVIECDGERTYGDLGFEFGGEKEASITDNDYFTCVNNTKEWATYFMEENGVDKGTVPILELYSAVFEYEEVAWDEEDIKNIDKETYSFYMSEKVADSESVVYRVALCTEEFAKEHNIENIAGKIDYFVDPSDYFIDEDSDESFDLE